MPGRRHYINVGSTVFYRGDSRSESEWETAVRHLADEGHYLLAYDLAMSGLERFPESAPLKQVAARALCRTGGFEEARKLLEPLCPQFLVDHASRARVREALRSALGPQHAVRKPGRARKRGLHALPSLLAELGGITKGSAGVGLDEESIGLLARVYKDIWRYSRRMEDARLARDTYACAFQLTGGYWTGVNAATLSWLMGDRRSARTLARQVLTRCEEARSTASGDDEYWIPATIGEALLLLGDRAGAIGAYRDAAALVGRSYDRVVSSLQQLHLMQAHGFDVPPEILESLAPPTVVFFAGHMIDQPGRTPPRFPPAKEAAVRAAIDRELQRLDARIGYTSAACGADILLIEAMLDRDAEVNIVLPFDPEDFIRTSVAHAGGLWVKRYRRALKLAKVVKYVTEEPYLGDEILFRFAGQVFHGYAELQARTMETTAHLLAVWDGKESTLLGGTADIVTRWPDPKTQHVIRLDKLRGSGRAASRTPEDSPSIMVPPRQPTAIETLASCKRVVRTLLFADIAGYSKLPEPYTAFYLYRFLEHVARSLPGRPPFVNTWGDAVFAVMESATPLAEYALALQDAVAGTDWVEQGLPAQLSIRIGLHAGPVFEGEDPITRRTNFYGTHVNRAARIEPVAVPGCVYASEQFMALLATEQLAAEQHAAADGARYQASFAWQYAGTIPLAKEFGSQAVYRLRRGYPA